MALQNVHAVLDRLRRLAGPAALVGASDAELLRRFERCQDQQAFAELVTRYGPLVQGVCRRALREPHDADDAFQATFLVLARKAGAVRNQQAVGSWLTGVAYRVCQEARTRLARRRRLEAGAAAAVAAAPPTPDPVAQAASQEVRGLLDDELGRLPDRLRQPLVLCYLEGKTNDEAAGQLGCPTSSLSSRLRKGREMLRRRLTRRGVALSAGGVAAVLGESADAALPAGFAGQTARAAAEYVAGASSLSPEVVALTEGVVRAMRFTCLRPAVGLAFGAAVLLAVGAVLAGGSEAAPTVADERPQVGTTSEPAEISDAQRDAALAKGLAFLVAEQSADGHWAIREDKNDQGATGLALLALLRADNVGLGKAHPHASAIDRGIRYLLQSQAGDGRIGPPLMYSHAMATMALCEAHIAFGGERLKGPCQKAVDFLAAAQTADGAWGYQPAGGAAARGDTSITGWQLQALRLARAAGLNVPEAALTKAGKYLDSVGGPGGGYAYMPGAPTNPSMTASGVLSRLNIGEKTTGEGLGKGVDLLREAGPGSKVGFAAYYRYHATLVMNRAAPDAWRWNHDVRRLLVPDQAADGGWGPTPEGDRVYLTVFNLLALLGDDDYRRPPLMARRDLPPEEVGRLWQGLLGADLPRSCQAVRQLAAAPDQAVLLLKKELRPVAPADPQQVRQWLADLDSERFEAREAATEELAKLGELATAALRQALEKKPSLEVRQRLGPLLARAEAPSTVPEKVRALQGIRILERIGTPEARRILKPLAEGAAGAGQTEEAAAALARLANPGTAAPPARDEK